MRLKITNRLGLPEPIVAAVANDPYDSGQCDYTVTGLLKPPRMAQLQRTCEVTVDAADRIPALLGQVVHLILERAGRDLEALGYVVEKRFYATYAVDGKIFKISGGADSLFDPAKGKLSDYKLTSVAAVKYGLKEDHAWQVNMLAQLIRRNGLVVEQGEVIPLLKDWSPMRIYGNYPPAPALVQPVALLPGDEVDEFIKTRIRLHEAAKVTLPLCSAEERWNRPKFALMKPGKASAVKVEESIEALNAYAQANPKKAEGCRVEERPGEDVRCLYCDVRPVCEQYQGTIERDEDGFSKVSE